MDLQPNNVQALNYAAHVYRRQGQWTRHLSELARCEQLDPRDARIPTQMGASYCRLRMWGEAARFGSRSLALDPHNKNGMIDLLVTALNGTADIDKASRILAAFPADDLTVVSYKFGGDISNIIGDWLSLSIVKRDFAAALQTWERQSDHVTTERDRLSARAAIHVLAGDAASAREEIDRARTLVEAQPGNAR